MWGRGGRLGDQTWRLGELGYVEERFLTEQGSMQCWRGFNLWIYSQARKYTVLEGLRFL